LDSFFLIVNPAAGGGRAGRAAPAVEQALRDAGSDPMRRDTRDLEHARELASEAATDGLTVLVLGGDGLAGAVADVLRTRPSSVMGVLPGGRGNDLARVLGTPRDPVAAAVALTRGEHQAIDLGEVNGRAFVGIASVGFDSVANRIANEAPPWLGNMVYAYGALRALAGWRAARFQVAIEPQRERFAFSGYSVAAANSPTYGGGMRLAPAASLTDGMLDIVSVADVSKLRFLANLPKVFKGTHVQLPSVEVRQARTVEISADRPFAVYADGEVIAQLPATVRTLPAAIQMLVPRATKGEQ
jgi:YegS/Rv2252/BmrU family lipid kinase